MALLRTVVYSYDVESLLQFMVLVGVMNKPPQETSQEFQIQLEEFPALPGKSSKC